MGRGDMENISMIRSNIYKLLSIGYSRPKEDLYLYIKGGDYWKGLKDAVFLLPWDELRKKTIELENQLKMVEDSYQEFDSRYTMTFDVGKPSPPCPLYEGVYRGGLQRPQLLHEVLMFYKTFGLSLSEDFKELHDHLVAELEFMHFLSFKEVQAEKEGVEVKPYILAESDFMNRHLGLWFSDLRAVIEKTFKKGFYPALASFTDLFIVLDRRYLGSLLNKEEERKQI
ncbi:MAG: hypothetical protein A2073_05170 [Deltaproteobacteria bacterium GWC2_42_11]|nr:MAG: hypothetical protein A2073_05170 [Deltaproteobacteria bacterium GWC2_42_11]